MDRIKICGLEVFARHGVYPEENALGQKFVICADLFLDTRRAGLTDDLEASVNYGEVCQFIQTFMQEHTYQLIEAAAERLVRALLLTWPAVKQVNLELQKPWAPVGLPLETVAVEICRGWHRAYVALGSNLGDRKGYLDFAVEQLSAREDCRVEAVSDYVETAPYGGVEQDDFLNGALELMTLLTPEELLDALHEIEAAAGRERKVHWGPRTLDLDILLYDDLILDTPELHIPHADMHRRSFVLGPLAQIAPWVRHPLTRQTAEEMLRSLEM
ncbi:MAG: 2-amino-4-hydroxy-6-hydroxymethyldihydropteridine diphosphokinase [Lachnospiraceae bacterium]|nr:2-amino-4-hydroxy-6-hydroxymethyldihydropteridine diphosphokinase [Lachnospiraceae bacterium]